MDYEECNTDNTLWNFVLLIIGGIFLMIFIGNIYLDSDSVSNKNSENGCSFEKYNKVYNISDYRCAKDYYIIETKTYIETSNMHKCWR